MANRAATQGLALSVVHAVVLGGAGVAVMPAFLRMFTSSESVVSLGLRYSVIVFSFSLSIMTGIAFEKIFQAVGRMKVTMVGLTSGCVANIILDPLFIFGFGPFPAMGIEGAALATGIGQTISLLIYLAVYFMRPLSVRIGRQFLRPDGATVRRLYAVGIPATLNLALSSLLITALNAILAAYSGVYILVLGVYYKLQTFLYLPANGFVQGMRPLVGYNYGAGEYGRVRKLYNLVLIMSGAIMAAGTVICLIFPAQLMGLFTETPETIEAGETALRIISAGFLVSAVSVTSSGALEGLGKGAASLVISLARYVVVILPAAFLLSRLFGAAGVSRYLRVGGDQRRRVAGRVPPRDGAPRLTLSPHRDRTAETAKHSEREGTSRRAGAAGTGPCPPAPGRSRANGRQRKRKNSIQKGRGQKPAAFLRRSYLNKTEIAIPCEGYAFTCAGDARGSSRPSRPWPHCLPPHGRFSRLCRRGPWQQPPVPSP